MIGVKGQPIGSPIGTVIQPIISMMGTTTFKPASVGNLLQWLTTTTVLTAGIFYDASTTGDARDIQLGRCYDFDGVNDYLAAAHLSGSETVVSSGGTSTPSISAGRIDFTAGTCWALLLSDGTFYKCDEQEGTIAYDSSGNGNDGVITNATLSSFHATQNIISFQNDVGYTPAFTVPDTLIVAGETLETIAFTIDLQGETGRFIIFSESGSKYCLIAESGSLSTNLDGGFGTCTYTIDGVAFSGTRGELFTLLSVAGPHDVVITTSVTLDLYFGGYTVIPGWDVDGQLVSNLVVNGIARDGSTFIPRDESDTTKDAKGNALQYKGRVPYNAVSKAANCGTFDGTNDELQFVSLTGGTTIVSFGGTATPTIDTVNNKITSTAGTLYNILLSDGTHLALAEGAGPIAYDSSGNGNHATITNATLSSFWGSTQDIYFANLANGFTPYYSQNDTLIVAGETIETIAFTIDLQGKTDRFVLFSDSGSNYLLAAGSAASILDGGFGTCTYTIDGVAFSGTRGELLTLLSVAGPHDVVITASATVDLYFGGFSNWEIDGQLVSNLVVNGVEYYGSTRIPSVSATVNAVGHAVTNPGGKGYNFPESTIDMTGGVASPAAVSGGWPTAYAGTAITSDKLFSRVCPLLVDRMLAYEDDLTGGELTAVTNYTTC